MPGGSVGRNDPCPCGSGKKYKKCCFGKTAASVEATPAALPPTGILYEDDIDKLSNSVLDAIDEKRYEQAEKLCEQLLRDYPEVIDGHDRYAKLREAQGRFPEAADHYARALEIIAQHPSGYDPEMVKLFEERRQQAISKSLPRP